jgi:hypothetical protein
MSSQTATNPFLRRVTVLLALTVPAAPAAAQVQVQVTAALPSIRFEVAPPLVVVREGVQVVPEYEEEVFHSGGWYWHRRHDVWYRTRDHRGGWVVVERRYVPVALVGEPPGKYKHWKAGKHMKMKDKEKHHKGKGKGHGKGHGKWK